MKTKLYLASALAILLSGFNTLSSQNSNVQSANPSYASQQIDTPPGGRTCGSGILPQQFETWLQSVTPVGGGKGDNNMTTQSVFNIPVIVHIVHNGETVNTISATSGNNLNAAQIIDQINILNRDFNGTNPDTSSIPAPFKPFLGKFKINFCLAVVNPTGGVLAEPGIDRINRNSKGWTAPPYSSTYCSSTIKPQSIWDVNRYFNIWVLPLGSSLLGFATFPNPATSGLGGLSAPYGDATSDGVVILNTAFGSNGTAAGNAPYNLGRTTTHEVGHWLGLRHIWGDGTCQNDFCNDTPQHSNSTFGCPSYPNATGCAGFPSPPGRMFMNFMDYTNDACMYMFTKDQAYRAQLIMTHSPIRHALLTSTVCNLPSVTNDLGIMYVEAPTYSQVINCDNFVNPVFRVKNYGSNSITAATFTYNINGANTQTYNWTGSLAPNASVTINLPTINGVPNGTNGFNVRITSVNAGVDTYTPNNFNNQMFVTVNGFSIAAAGASTVCAGNQATLTASGSATSYTWNPGNVTGTVAVVSPAATTMYTLSGASGTCVTTRTVQVTVNATPTVAVQNQTICTGGTATLIASGASTYSWNTSQTTPTIFVTPASNTTYTVTGNIGTCSNTKTVSVTIGTALGVNIAASSTAICSGNTVTLTASGASTYTWNTASNNAQITVAPVASTVYTVNGASGTCNGSKTIAVNVTTTPTLILTSTSQTVCNGNNASVTASGASGYTWQPGNTTNALLSINPASSIVYTVTGANGSCTDVKTHSITVNAKPTINVASSSPSICLGAVAQLFSTGALTYTWQPGNIVNQNPNVSPTANTTYTVFGTGSNGCTGFNTITMGVSPCTSIDQLFANDFKVSVYPNPFKDELTIEANEAAQITLTNALGQVVRTIQVNGKATLETNDLPKAFYILSVRTQNGSRIVKLIKE